MPPPGRLVVKKGSKSLGQGFRLDADTVVLNGDENARGGVAEANLHAAGLADIADGVFGVADQIQKNLDELVGVADDEREAGDGLKFDLDVVAAQRVFV